MASWSLGSRDVGQTITLWREVNRFHEWHYCDLFCSDRAAPITSKIRWSVIFAGGAYSGELSVAVDPQDDVAGLGGDVAIVRANLFRGPVGRPSIRVGEG